MPLPISQSPSLTITSPNLSIFHPQLELFRSKVTYIIIPSLSFSMTFYLSDKNIEKRDSPKKTITFLLSLIKINFFRFAKKRKQKLETKATSKKKYNYIHHQKLSRHILFFRRNERRNTSMKEFETSLNNIRLFMASRGNFFPSSKTPCF
jgi:hypothetical protein